MPDKKNIVKSIFVSDVHLGSKYSKSADLRHFLDNYHAENLFLVGDIIDGWRLRKKFYWDNDASFLIRKIIGMMKKHDTNVYYISGNHDEFLRNFDLENMGNIHVCTEMVYKSLSGKNILINHGDFFDTICNKITLLYSLGNKAYSVALHLNFILNKIRLKLGFRYWAFSCYMKKRVKHAVNFINGFEHAICKYAKQKECDAVIAGHIHDPCIRNIDGVEYYNCGDWMENCTAIIENLDGTIELYRHHQIENLPSINGGKLDIA